MILRRFCPRQRLFLGLLSLLHLNGALAFHQPDFLPQSFYFSWDPPNEPFPIPVAEQCQVLPVTWQRGTATGPSPTAPYFIQIYTSAFVFPFVIPAGTGLSFDWAVPFAPGTLFQACMFDKFGNTGGCQATYTVIPSNSSNSPSCPNMTFPDAPLDVNAVVHDGPMSQFGWIDQCTDIAVTPTNGTPPYIFTIAPSLHPPYNITIPDMSTTNWTVSLSWASPFFISVADSQGNSWSQGPLHSGGGGPTDCLAVGATQDKSQSSAIPIGAGVGGTVVGLLVGIAATWMFLRHRHQQEAASLASRTQLHPYSRLTGNGGDSLGYYQAVPGHGLEVSLGTVPSRPTSAGGPVGPSGYTVEPFVMPTEDGRIAPAPTSPVIGGANVQRGTSVAASTSPTTYAPTVHGSDVVPPTPAPGSPRRPGASVYVIHHDGGRAPVTVYHEDGTEVVELPPSYTQGINNALRTASSAVTPGTAPMSTSAIPPAASTSASDNWGEGRSDRMSMSAGTDYTTGSGVGGGGSGGDGLGAAHLFNQPRRPATIRKGPREPSTATQPSVYSVQSPAPTPQQGHEQYGHEQHGTGPPDDASLHNPWHAPETSHSSRSLPVPPGGAAAYNPNYGAAGGGDHHPLS
ncbi:hypothetical protein BDN72DRAFT_890554 [Pluteus cervinus]|uniref:Uncharacterized protein n=1 Tax=Pluteus cervinus TaxID=181527 RepID=A0ACD3BFT2_9AGAR|nr:hypothetical protein BDN72DRAFT_890554 [Pluteus cervinus]